MRIHIDDSELRNLEVDISHAPGRMQRNARSTIIKGARRINKEMVIDASGHRYLPRLGKGVTYQLIDPWTAEIGIAPRNRKQGSLAHIIAYGSANNAPVYDHTAGLRRAMPAILDDFADAAESSVLGGEGVA